MHAEGKTLALFHLHQQPKVGGSLACSGRVLQQHLSPIHWTCSKFNQCRKLRLYANPELKKPKLKVGNQVRLSMWQMRFRKGYVPRWTDELFQYARVFRDNPPYYKIKDLGGKWLEGTF